MPKPVRKMQKANATAQAAVLPKISPELLDQLVKGPMTAESIDDASRAFKKALIERALGAEMSHHLGYAPARTSQRRRPTTATAGVERRF
jgi:transposase-like protein